MTLTSIARTLVLCGVVLSWSQVQAKSPIPVETVGLTEEFAAEIDHQMTLFAGFLAKAKQFDEKLEYVTRAGGVIACCAQALVEHPDEKANANKHAAVRDAAIAVQEVGSHEEATAAVEALKSTLAGNVEGEHELEYSWDSLISMYDMMEEINERNYPLKRAIRRPKGTLEERRTPVAIAILTVAMYEDTSYCSDEQIGPWQKMSKEYQEAMTELSKAIAAKDKAKAAELYLKGNETCNKCHLEIRDAE